MTVVAGAIWCRLVKSVFYTSLVHWECRLGEICALVYFPLTHPCNISYDELTVHWFISLSLTLVTFLMMNWLSKQNQPTVNLLQSVIHMCDWLHVQLCLYFVHKCKKNPCFAIVEMTIIGDGQCNADWCSSCQWRETALENTTVTVTNSNISL